MLIFFYLKSFLLLSATANGIAQEGSIIAYIRSKISFMALIISLPTTR